MMRSMYSAVSGLRVHQTKMDVIGNNIANVNTIGYKKGQVSFKEAFSQVISGAGAPNGGKGGTNPQQIGLGLQLGSINTVHTKGSTQRTDNPTDLMIDGEGFFIVSDDPNAENRYYTRAGNFNFDLDGNLVTPDGFKVLGTYIGDPDYAKFLGIDENKEIDGIKVNKSIPAPPSASTSVEVRGNLDSRFVSGDDYVTDVTIKDSLGNSYIVKLNFNKTNDNEWEFAISSVRDIANNVDLTPAPNVTQAIKFDLSGNLETGGSTTLTITKPGVSFGTGNDEISIDLSKLTQFANEADAKGYDIENASGQSGRSSGSVTGYAIDPSGKVIASFSNGMKIELWQLKLANFDNPMGLVKSGNNFFEKTPNSGDPQMGNPGNSGLGAISPGALEMSNVDLSMEFTEMITTQRGFQANSRVITTTDEMLQELTNMKR